MVKTRRFSLSRTLKYCALFALLALLSCQTAEEKRYEQLAAILEKAKKETAELPLLEVVRAKAETGDVIAQYDYAMRLRNGRKAPQDYKLAYEWLLKAAKQGHASAQREIASYYYYLAASDSFDIPSRIKQLSPAEKHRFALFWFTESAKGCEGEAEYNLSNIGEGHGLSSGNYPIVPDIEAARKWMLLAATHKYNRAIYDTTRWYLAGKHFTRNCSEAIAWNIAAEKLDVQILDEKVEIAISTCSESEHAKGKNRAEEIVKEIAASCSSRIRYGATETLPAFPE